MDNMHLSDTLKNSISSKYKPIKGFNDFRSKNIQFQHQIDQHLSNGSDS